MIMYLSHNFGTASRNLLWKCPQNYSSRIELTGKPAKKIFRYYSNVRFQKPLPEVISQSLSEIKFLTDLDIQNRIHKIFEYNTLERVPLHQQLTIFAYQALSDSRNVTDKTIDQINVLAWCVEMLQSYYLVIDDIEDEAQSRNGQLCWHLLPNVGTLALNDTSIMRSIIHEILRQNLSEDVFPKMIKLFNEAHLRCDYGQYLDAITAKTKNYSKFNMELYTTIADNKCTFYGIKFPILAALTFLNKENEKSRRNVDNAFDGIGFWVQMHNDMMELSDESSKGKTDTDIKKGKCSWPAVAALRKSNSRQREIFFTHYGSSKPEDVERILHLYDELGLKAVFHQEQSARLESVRRQIKELPTNSIPSENFFNTCLEKLYDVVLLY